jgi:hypothetical protein
MAANGYSDLATTGDFFMATDILDSSKSQHVVWAAQLDGGGLAWTRKSS